MKLRKEETYILHSKVIEDDFKISICLPVGYEKEKTYPLVYVLDSNIFYEIFKGVSNLLQFGQEIPEIIVVGIGYPDDAKHMSLRDRDYLHAKSLDSDLGGGAGAFYDFMTSEIMPYIESKYPVKESVLFGDSYSGLFALYSLFQKKKIFSKYIIGSPSIYYDQSSIFKWMNPFNSQAEIFLGVGGLEAIYEPAFAGMVSNVELMEEKLKGMGYKDLNMTIFDNETHLSVIPLIMTRGLRHVFHSKYMSDKND
ncbi:alpha/beta hydrolase [Acidaminobacter sp. JC074]|uniref:alpha/beta hydrolase n=1 Tax=Acidaminobacter sp. JC074 TaxID=2530199 RepID=UPI001F115AE8|nr:alpha/beta hydrolase-fold protein [Acidaminobacter sp. JC074]